MGPGEREISPAAGILLSNIVELIMCLAFIDGIEPAGPQNGVAAVFFAGIAAEFFVINFQ